jgi:hypothetical protein
LAHVVSLLFLLPGVMSLLSLLAFLGVNLARSLFCEGKRKE